MRQANNTRVHKVGTGLVQQYEAAKPQPDKGLALRATYFATNITKYLAYRREVREVKWLHMGLEAAQQLQMRQGERLFSGSLGSFYNQAGSKPEALEYHEQSLTICWELNDQWNEAITLNNIGKVYDDIGEKEQALNYFRQALPLRREVGDRAGEGLTLWNIGAVLEEQDDLAGAINVLEQALTLFQQVRSPYATNVERRLAQMREILEQQGKANS